MITTINDRLDTSMYLDALVNQTKLQRCQLVGAWNLVEEDLVRFVELHANSLRCLILDDSVFLGNWSTTLRAIGKATAGKLEYFRARKVLQDANDGVRGETHDFEVTKSDFADFECTVEWLQWESSLLYPQIIY
jgi:hypothetical protein